MSVEADGDGIRAGTLARRPQSLSHRRWTELQPTSSLGQQRIKLRDGEGSERLV
jgi:hypothetical protein